MFGFFRRKKKQKSAEQSVVNTQPTAKEQPSFVQGAKIAYQPELIDQFKKDHKELLTLFTNIVNAAEGRDTVQIPALLTEFKRRIMGHLLQENIQLYVYLKYLYADDSMTSELTKSMQKEMSAIGKTVLDFISKYTAKGAKYDQEFRDGLQGIGAVLVERIKVEEENLYGLYLPPGTTL